MTIFGSAFITGASSGIGARLALELGKAGVRVVLAARREPELSVLAQDIQRAGGRADTCVLDVARTDDVCAAVARWDEACGGLDLVVANAGIDAPADPAGPSWSSVERVMQVNAMGALATIVSAVKPMCARRRGTVAAVSSLAAMRGLPAHGAYSASKAAVSTYLEALRADVAPYGVRVVDIRPGFVDTPLSRKNRFKMPFVMELDDAVRLTIRALERGQAIVKYPWQMSLAMMVAESMPDALWRGIAPRLPR